MLMALLLEGVSHGARSCANLSTALASTNLCGIAALSPTDATAVGRYENTLEKIYCLPSSVRRLRPQLRLCSFVDGEGTIQKV